MRWSNLSVENEESRTLPGYSEPAAVRRFDAPEAMDVRFYEVQAKSVVNRVPKASRMPFRWTINPYRGCTHGCVWCLGGDAPILMADGRTEPIGDIRVGDRIYGTERQGGNRRYVTTEVQAHWATIKPAFRVTLEDGTELIASGDHRFLTDRGWKFVTGRRGPGGRPYLTTGTKLKGTGQFQSSPEGWLDFDYRRGYLCGLIRGDGHVSSSLYQRSERPPETRHVFRLALVDIEPLQRATEFLSLEGIRTGRYTADASGRGRRPMSIVQSSSRDHVEAVQAAISWPRMATDSWCKGFLAGIYDAEGSHSSGLVRIANTCPELIDWTSWCLRRFGFRFVLVDSGRDNGLRYVRLLGGIREQLRFFLTVDPATTRKRSIVGKALKTFARLGVVSIEPLPKSMRLFDITTGTGDFIANGVVSHNCFARPTHEYLDMNAGRDFEREIVVKVNAPEVARAELSRPRWKREHVALGTNTDPYQWVESRYRLMPGIWEAMRDTRTPSSVLTKSPLLLRDVDLMKQIPGFRANLSIPTIDEKAWRATEPHTPNPYARIEAVAELNRVGIPTGVLIAPLQPGINDQPEQVGRIVELCIEAGATSIGGIALHLRGSVKQLWFEWLEEHRPDLIPRYRKLYARGAYAPQEERDRLSAMVKTGTRLGPPARFDRAEPEPTPLPEPEPEQTKLF